jgi:uncharacterized membrane protein YjjB (DUF3815 family)
MDWFLIISNAFWCGCAAAGFGILFNAPLRSLVPVWIGGFVAGFVKFFVLHSAFASAVILSSFLAGMFAGIVAIPLANWRNVPAIVVALPSVIPLVPGAFAYKAMMGLMKLSKYTGSEYSDIISETVYNGVMAFFVVLAITFGLLIPLIAMRANFMNLILRKKPPTP